MVKIALITNIPSPYRVLLYNELGRVYGNSFKVFYCSRSEPNRKWDLPDLQHNYLFLSEGLVSFFNKSFYLNWDIWKNLKLFNPSMIITGGFNPTMLFSIIFARMYKKRHLINTDAWEITEASLNKYHILLRKFIYQNVAAFLPVSLKGKNNFIKNYNIPEHKIFIGHYSIQNERFSQAQSAMKRFDLIFSGQFISRKMPLFFCDVVIELAKQKPDLKVVLLGSGPLENEILEKLKSSRINFTYPGFIQQDEIPKFFGASKIFLFPLF